MCTACVAEGAMYVGGAAVSLRVLAHRAASRRARGLLPPLKRPSVPPAGPTALTGSTGAPDPPDRTEFSTGTPHL